MFIFNKKRYFVAVVFLFRRRKYHSKRAWDLKKGGWRLLLILNFICHSMFSANFYLPPNRQLPQQSGGNNSAGVIDRKRRTPYSPICGLGASVGYEP